MILRLTKGGGFSSRPPGAKYRCPHCMKGFAEPKKKKGKTFCPYCHGELIMPKEPEREAKPVILW